jgi:hypothetical protein
VNGTSRRAGRRMSCAPPFTFWVTPIVGVGRWARNDIPALSVDDPRGVVAGFQYAG